MNFLCDKNLLCETVNNILPAVSTKSTILALEGILLKCKNNILSITGYNLELGITKKIEVNSKEDGEIILSASLFSNILNRMPSGEVNLSSDEKLLTLIKCSDVEFTILGISSEDYPEIPVISEEKQFELPSFILKNMISQTLFAISKTDQKPIITGSLFDLNDGILNIVSLDLYRLALRKEKVNVNGNFKFVVPGKTLSEIVKLISKLSDDDEQKVVISVSNKHIQFKFFGYVIISRLLEGEFLDYQNSIPKESETKVKVNTKIFLDSINRASIMINERAKSPIRCTFKENEIKLFCETPLGKVNDTINADVEGEEIKIGFNNSYMADALKVCDCENIVIEMKNSFSPMKIVPIDDDSFLYLVLPVRMK